MKARTWKGKWAVVLARGDIYVYDDEARARYAATMYHGGQPIPVLITEVVSKKRERAEVKR